MPRITVRISEETEEWLDEERDRLSWSKAKAGGHCINLLQNSSLHIDPDRSTVEYSDAPQSDSSELAALRGEVEALRERVEALEAGQSSNADVAADESPPEPAGGEIDAEWILQHGEWSQHEVAAKPQRADALYEALERVRDDPGVTTSELVEQIASDDRIELSESNIQGGLLGVLRDVPGIDPPGTGQQRWHPSDDS